MILALESIDTIFNSGANAHVRRPLWLKMTSRN